MEERSLLDRIHDTLFKDRLDWKHFEVMVSAGFTGTSLAISIMHIVNYCSSIDSIRDSVYAHADKITPELIEYTNTLVSEVGKKDFLNGWSGLGVAGAGATLTYFLNKRLGKSQIK